MEEKEVLFLARSLNEFNFSVRTEKCLQTLGVVRVFDLVQKTETDVLKVKHAGRKTLDEIQDFLLRNGWKLGMLTINKIDKKYF